MAAIEPSQLGWVIIGQGIKPPTIRTVTSFRSDSERAAEDDRVGSCAILPAIIVASAGDLGKAAPEIKRQCRLVIGGHLEKGRICPAHGGFLDKEAEGGRGTPLAATVRVGGEGQDFRFVEDNWESPTLGAWGLGWEVWLNGMEVTQFTYFQQAGGLECKPVTGEITYGLERLAMYLQNVDNVYDLVWTTGPQGVVKYGDVYHQNEVEQSAYNFEHADVAELFHRFDACEKEALKLVELGLPLPAYEQVCKASHSFNLLDARRAISVTERQAYIGRVRTLAAACAAAFLQTAAAVA